MSGAPEEYLEVVQTLERVQDQLETLAVRGLRATDASQLAPVDALRDEFARVGASGLAGRLSTLRDHVVNDDRGSAASLLTADSAVRLFERRLTLDVAAAKLHAFVAAQRSPDDPSEGDSDDAPAANGASAANGAPGTKNGASPTNGHAPAAPPLLIAPADRAKLPESLRRLAGGVEELLKSGLTAAGASLRETFEVAFREAARLKLLRLAGSLRIAIEELGRFTRSETEFSKKRLLFFLSRCWILSRMLAQALETNDDASAARLLHSSPGRPVDELTLATLGVAKRVARGANVGFEFRLRTTRDAAGLPAGASVVWSCVYPAPNANVPPEAYLRLEQKQKFKPWSLLEGREFTVRNASLNVDGFGVRRLGLHDQSSLEFGEPFTDWPRLYTWDSTAALEKIVAHRPSPLDVPTELSTEVIVPDWVFGEPRPQPREGRQIWPGAGPAIDFQAEIAAAADGDALRKAVADQAARAPRLPLFGVMHYEMGEAVLQPLSTLGDDGPIHLTVSNEAVNMKELLKTIKF